MQERNVRCERRATGVVCVCWTQILCQTESEGLKGQGTFLHIVLHPCTHTPEAGVSTDTPASSACALSSASLRVGSSVVGRACWPAAEVSRAGRVHGGDGEAWACPRLVAVQAVGAGVRA